MYDIDRMKLKDNLNNAVRILNMEEKYNCRSNSKILQEM